jgi:hypothetical protein
MSKRVLFHYRNWWRNKRHVGGTTWSYYRSIDELVAWLLMQVQDQESLETICSSAGK